MESYLSASLHGIEGIVSQELPGGMEGPVAVQALCHEAVDKWVG